MTTPFKVTSVPDHKSDRPLVKRVSKIRLPLSEADNMRSTRGEKTMLICAFAAAYLHESTNGLVPAKVLSFRQNAKAWKSGRTSYQHQRTTPTMYFDDISPRHVRRWNPSSNIPPLSSSADPAFHNQTLTTAASRPLNQDSQVDKTKNEMERRMQNEKQAMIRKLLVGYDAQTAAQLEDSEIERQTQFWAQESGVVGDYFLEEMYHDILGMGVSHATSLTGCLADMWKFIQHDVIDAYADHEFKTTHRWSLKRKDKRNKKPLEGSSHVFFCVFSHCQEAYDYKAFTMLVAALEFCKDLCVYFGKEFSVTLFHPKFKNSPTLLSPERHSPFPTIALQFGPAFTKDRIEKDAAIFKDRRHHLNSRSILDKMEDSKSKDTSAKGESCDINDPLSTSSSEMPEPDEADEQLAGLVERKIPDLDTERAKFEVLFNSAAAPGMHDSVWTPPATANEQDDDSNHDSLSSMQEEESGQPAELDTSSLSAHFASVASNSTLSGDDLPVASGPDPVAKRFMDERKRRRRDIPARRIQQYIDEWAQKAKHKGYAGKTNLALLYWDSILPEDGFVICDGKTAETVYGAIWKVILELYELGEAASAAAVVEARKEKLEAAKDKRSGKAGKKSKKDKKKGFDIARWLNTLSLSGGGEYYFADESSSSEKSNLQSTRFIPPEQIISRVFVTTKFLPYNAQSFKRFAITVNAALKRFTDKRMFLEIFHPEYVGNKGYNNALRRSPFPCIQICYHVSSKPSPQKK